MPKVYIIMSHTGTYLSKLIRRVTGNTYNHASISMKKDLSEMYSFGRRYPYNAICGGFVQEYQHKGTFKRFKNTICNILEIEVSSESYSIMSDIIRRFSEEKKRFKFNFMGIFFARKKINYQKSYRKFYCSQFVNYLLVCAHVVPENFFGSAVTPQDFSRIPNAVSVYEGYLRDYAPTSDDEEVEPISEQEVAADRVEEQRVAGKAPSSTSDTEVASSRDSEQA